MGNETTEAERLGKVEVKLDSIEKFLSRLEKVLDSMEKNYVTKERMEMEIRLLKGEIDGIQKGLIEFREDNKSKKQGIPNWVSALAALAAVVIAIYK